MPKEELECAQKYFFCTSNIVDIKSNDIVVGRYSMLPYYDEVESNINILGAKLINSYKQHLYIADLGAYVNELGEDITPKTWSELCDVNTNEAPFILKGQTNSKKNLWNTHCYAKTFEDAKKVYYRLSEDTFISQQKIYIRKYIPLVSLGTSITGMPFAKEFRFFVLNKKIISGGFYWSPFIEDIIEQGYAVPDISEVPEDFLNEVIWRVGNNCNFYGIDVAQDVNGKWWVIELNEGQCMGLSANEPEIFYKALYDNLIDDKSGSLYNTVKVGNLVVKELDLNDIKLAIII